MILILINCIDKGTKERLLLIKITLPIASSNVCLIVLIVFNCIF